MANGNTVTVVGNVTRDPELRFTGSGQPMANFGIAVNRRWQNKNTNEWEEEVSFFNCTTWREQAENVAESLTKGDRVVVTGRLQQRSWETDQGDKRSVVEIQVDEIGPSLRWATARIQKNERTDNPAGQGGGGAAAAKPVQNEPGGGYADGEEPF